MGMGQSRPTGVRGCADERGTVYFVTSVGEQVELLPAWSAHLRRLLPWKKSTMSAVPHVPILDDVGFAHLAAVGVSAVSAGLVSRATSEGSTRLAEVPVVPAD